MNKPMLYNLALATSAREGLSKAQKTLEAKWFYDQAGSVLFEQITALPEYYPTRTEKGILKDCVEDLAALFPVGSTLVELGSGASIKTRILLDGISTIERYIPLDISAEFLKENAADLARDYPSIEIAPLAVDFDTNWQFPIDALDHPKVAFFPGSTIGNLEVDEAIELLVKIRRWPNVMGLLLGVDLVKSVERLIAAYDDTAGITAAFNKNILRRLNREANAMIDLSEFRHEARWNVGASRIEMHLVAQSAISFCVDNMEFLMRAGESIHTENSHKYSYSKIDKIAGASGWTVGRFFTDKNEDFGVAFLVPKD